MPVYHWWYAYHALRNPAVDNTVYGLYFFSFYYYIQ
jgi:hypothetical protein